MFLRGYFFGVSCTYFSSRQLCNSLYTACQLMKVQVSLHTVKNPFLLGSLTHERYCNTLLNHGVNDVARLDWIVQGFTSPSTQYRLYGRRFLQVKRPNQQYQSTEGESCKGKQPREQRKHKIHICTHTHTHTHTQSSRQIQHTSITQQVP